MESLNANKASGHDGLPPRLLKMISKEIAPSLCTIFNTSIETAAWPETWKRGTWTPVFKKDDRHDTSNYRPITVLPVVGKIYEKLLSKQITDFMDPILSDNSIQEITQLRDNPNGARLWETGWHVIY